MAKVNIKGRVAFITGASSGIGEATARVLASNGVNLILAGRRVERLNKLSLELKNSYSIDAFVLEVDLSEDKNIYDAFDIVSKKYDKIDILINNAGLALNRDMYYNSLPEDTLRMVRVNCESLVLLTRLVLPLILKSDDGFVINVSSVASDTPYAGGAIYCATKSFVEMFSDALRMDLMDKPVKVCNIKPGLVDTEFSTVRFKGDKNKADEVYKGIHPLYAEDIADNIEYVITRPRHVQVASITTMALNQGNAVTVHRE